jgi:hypothetical protein
MLPLPKIEGKGCSSGSNREVRRPVLCVRKAVKCGPVPKDRLRRGLTHSRSRRHRWQEVPVARNPVRGCDAAGAADAVSTREADHAISRFAAGGAYTRPHDYDLVPKAGPAHTGCRKLLWMNGQPIRIDRVFDDPHAVRAAVERHGPYGAVNTPPASAGGFSVKPQQPAAWRPKAGSRPQRP